MKNSMIRWQLTVLLIALGVGSQTVGLAQNQCGGKKGCFTPTRWNYMNAGQKAKCKNWPQFYDPNNQPAVIKYYLQKDVSKTISGSYSVSCFASGLDSGGCTDTNHDPSDGAIDSYTISSDGVAAHLERNEDCQFIRCVFEGSITETLHTLDPRLTTVTINEAGYCLGPCSGISKKYKDEDITTITSLTLTSTGNFTPPSNECSGQWVGMEHNVHRENVLEAYDRTTVPCGTPGPTGIMTTTIDTPVTIPAGELDGSGIVTYSEVPPGGWTGAEVICCG